MQDWPAELNVSDVMGGEKDGDDKSKKDEDKAE